jgi:hypothetical protein
LANNWQLASSAKQPKGENPFLVANHPDDNVFNAAQAAHNK